ncbi:2-hydroxyphytanoyl-lyase [Lasallia pustulata]|uniref:2-hydroxyacyl-CoA lyase n=1 Tax=Lasallia pustulata TaxID=136370 RepID=A0A1W5DBU5_9LECA|nr:2-hydroxyphytanoyl-lyase [Lasallia pustulata]
MTTPPTGAQIIARALRDLGVTVLFGIVGIPVVEIAEEAINLGIRFIGFRNEQAASYAASAYGYLTGRPGVCLVVGGPGVLHAMAGIGNSHANAFPLLLLAGSSESHLTARGAFQELDAISLLTPHTNLALRPSSLAFIPSTFQTAYRSAWYGRPGTGFVDLPADIIQGVIEPEEEEDMQAASRVPDVPKGGAEEGRLFKISQLLKSAKAPLIVIGKGAAYARAENEIRALVSQTQIPFLPTPMGKGVIADSHPLNAASARSTALKEADVVLVLGARLNWILHFGSPPKWSPHAQFIQVDISASEIGRNGSDAALGIVGDVGVVASQLQRQLGDWHFSASSSPYTQHLQATKSKNEARAAQLAQEDKNPMTYARVFDIIKSTLHALSPPDDGAIVYISEGANTMDISRSVFPVSHPRLRLDAGTYATMGVGLGYAIAAHAAYNGAAAEGEARPDAAKRKKKIVCLEGDSAFGFSAMEVETMARYGMDVLIFVVNNGGVYHGDSDDAEEWLGMQRRTREGCREGGLRSTSLGWEVGYEKLAEACGGKGFLVREAGELERATREGFAWGGVCVVNVVVEAGSAKKLEFGWQASTKKGKGKKGARL